MGPAGARDAQERARGYRDAMNAGGRNHRPRVTSKYPGDYTQEAGYRAAHALLDSEPRPTAIVAANDYCAIGALRALNDSGVRVPDEVALRDSTASPAVNSRGPR
jgi:LacI family transcriptional regulator